MFEFCPNRTFLPHIWALFGNFLAKNDKKVHFWQRFSAKWGIPVKIGRFFRKNRAEREMKTEKWRRGRGMKAVNIGKMLEFCPNHTFLPHIWALFGSFLPNNGIPVKKCCERGMKAGNIGKKLEFCPNRPLLPHIWAFFGSFLAKNDKKVHFWQRFSAKWGYSRENRAVSSFRILIQQKDPLRLLHYELRSNGYPFLLQLVL